jgi:hypothetical protein
MDSCDTPQQRFCPRPPAPDSRFLQSMVDRAFIELLTKSAEGLAAMTKSPDFDIAYSQYVDLLIRCVANTMYKDPPLAPGEIGNSIAAEQRATGRDWPRAPTQ